MHSDTACLATAYGLLHPKANSGTPDCMNHSAAGRGANVTTEDDEASTAAATDQDEDDDHVKLLNPVKVQILF